MGKNSSNRHKQEEDTGLTLSAAPKTRTSTERAALGIKCGFRNISSLRRPSLVLEESRYLNTVKKETLQPGTDKRNTSKISEKLISDKTPTQDESQHLRCYDNTTN